MKMRILVVVMLLVSGCSFFTKSPTTLDAALVQSSVQAATVMEVTRYPALKPAILDGSEKVVMAVNTGHIVTMAQLNGEINSLLAGSNLSPSNLAGAQTFIAGMTPIMNAYLAQGGVSSANIPKIPVQICMFAQWINNTLGGTVVCATQLITVPTVTN